MKLKIKWVVDPEPTGRYRSFERRSWPTAYYTDEGRGTYCAQIVCEDEYAPWRVRENNHKPLKLRIANHSNKPSWSTVLSKSEYATLADAKAALLALLEKYPHLVPDHLKTLDK